MTEEQIKMARHALGLDDLNPRRSYRNRYAAGVGSSQLRAWDDLCDRGLATRGWQQVSTITFHLTKAGATLVLRRGETLDKEDFPQ